MSIGERDAPETAAVDVGNPIVRRQALVQERVVRRQQVHDAAVVMHLAADEQPGLLFHRLTQVLVELRIQLGIGHGAGELAQLQPAAGEIVDQGVRTRIAQHAPHLLLQLRRIAQPSANRRLSQVVVRNAAPEEERQPRREVHIADAIGGAGRRRCGLALDAEEEARSGQDALEPSLDAGVEAVCRTLPIETEERLHVALGDRPPIGARRERRQNLSCARFLGRGVLGTADEYRAAARRVSGARRSVGTANRHDLHRGIAVVILVGRASEPGLRRLQHAFGLPEPLDEGHADLVRAGRHRDADLEIRVGGVHVVFPLGIALRVAGEILRGGHPLRFAAHRELLQADAVETDVELVRLAHADDVVVLLASQQDLDRVLRVERKVIPDQRAAP